MPPRSNVEFLGWISYFVTSLMLLCFAPDYNNGQDPSTHCSNIKMTSDGQIFSPFLCKTNRVPGWQSPAGLSPHFITPSQAPKLFTISRAIMNLRDGNQHKTLERTEKSGRCGENHVLNFVSFQLPLRKSELGNRLRTRKLFRLDPVSPFSTDGCSFPLNFYFSCFDLMMHIIFLPRFK